MHYTEAEAIVRICPMRSEKQGQIVYCVGSECMAWRWESDHKDHETPDPSWEGHCGLGH